MFIAHVFFQVAQAHREQALAAVLAERPSVSAMRGCLVFVPFVDPADPTGLGIVHEWATEADFLAYTASPGFAAVGRILRPLMTAAPRSRRFEATLCETVN